MTPNRTALLAEAESLLRSTPFTKEAASKVDSLLQLADRVTDRGELRKAVLQARNVELGRAPAEIPEASQEEDAQFRAYLFAPSQQAARELAHTRAAEMRAQGVATDAAGNFIVPASFAGRLEVAMKAKDGILQACSVFETPRGSALNYPILEDTGGSNIATIVSENAASASGPDAVFATAAYSKAPQWRAGLFSVSVEVMADSAIDFVSTLAAAAGERLAAGIGPSLIATLIAGSTSALTAAGPTAVTGDELISLVDAVDPAYADRGAWAMRAATYRTILKLKASTAGSYLFESERDVNGRPLLLGFPIFFCPSMSAMATTTKPIIFGDLSKLRRRIVTGSLVTRVYAERFAEYGEVGIETFLRTDAALLKTASSQPTKYITMA